MPVYSFCVDLEKASLVGIGLVISESIFFMKRNDLTILIEKKI